MSGAASVFWHGLTMFTSNGLTQVPKMECGFDSLSLDCIGQHFDPNEYINQQKEIDGILSTAFDDLSNISDDSFSDDDCGNFENGIDKSSKNKVYLQKQPNLNHQNGFTSTPIRTITNGENFFSKKISQNYQKIRNDISDIIEENCDFIDYSTARGDCKSDNVSLSEGEFQDFKVQSIHANKENQKEDVYENDGQIRDLYYLKEKCSEINSNYGVLQSKFKELHKTNENNLDTIEQLQSKIRFMDIQLKEEKQAKENMCRKATILESRVESLEYQLKEIHKSDYIARTNEEQEKLINVLRHKHEKELNELRNAHELEIDKLLKQLQTKDDDIHSKNTTIDKYKQECSNLKQMVKLNNEVMEKQMKEQMEIELKNVKEKTELSLLKSFDQSINKLKQEWEQKLEEDISKISLWVQNKLETDTENGRTKDDDDKCLSNLDVRLEKLVSLCTCLKSSIQHRENRIRQQTEQLKEAKLQLEEALIESKMSSSSISNNSDKGQMMEDLKKEMDKVKEESQMLTHKLHKYKQHYHMLVKRHKQEVDSLKSEFSSIIERLRYKSEF